MEELRLEIFSESTGHWRARSWWFDYRFGRKNHGLSDSRGKPAGGVIPNCAATRHVHFKLDGSGAAQLPAPKLEDWPEVQEAGPSSKRVNLDTVTPEEVATWKPGETLLLSGKMLTGRDAAHKKIRDLFAAGEELPEGVDLNGKFIYYVGPVDPVREEVVDRQVQPRRLG